MPRWQLCRLTLLRNSVGGTAPWARQGTACSAWHRLGPQLTTLPLLLLLPSSLYSKACRPVGRWPAHGCHGRPGAGMWGCGVRRRCC